MVVRWSDEDAAYIVTLPEFDDAKTHGDTYVEAVKQGKDLIDSFVLWYAQDGRPLPKPHLYFDGSDHSNHGKQPVLTTGH